MQLINMLTQLAICSLLVLFSTTIVKAEGNPNKPRMRSNSSAPATVFECGVYKAIGPGVLVALLPIPGKNEKSEQVRRSITR